MKVYNEIHLGGLRSVNMKRWKYFCFHYNAVRREELSPHIQHVSP